MDNVLLSNGNYKLQKISLLLKKSTSRTGATLAGGAPNARPRRGFPLSSVYMTSSCSINRAIPQVVTRCVARPPEKMFIPPRKMCWI